MMNQLHYKLIKSSPAYRKWHEDKDYHIKHWAIFVAVAVVALVSLTSAINRYVSVELSQSRAAMGTTYYVSTDGNDANPGTQTQPWRTIQKAANTMVAGDTAMVQAGSYDERVSPVNSGTAGSPITFLAASGQRPVVRGFSVTNKNYITIDRFEITNIGMSPDSTRNINISGGTGVQVLNNYIHDTAGQQCIISSAAASVFRGNTISYCGEAMSILGTVTGTKVITAGVNDQMKFSVQGGASQTITLPAGTYTGTSQYQTLATPVNALMTGATLLFGATGRFELRSSTMGPTSTITLEPVSNNAYATFGWTVGPGTIQGNHSSFTITGNDALIENNAASHVGDYVTTGNDITGVVVRNNTWGPSDPYSAQHIDGIQTNSINGTQKLLYEGNVSIGNNNADNHAALFQRPIDSLFILRYNSTYLSNGGFDFTRGGNTTLPGAFLYNNTLYNNANYISPGNVQVFSGTSLNNFARNNIWYNSSKLSPYSYSATVIDKDYDLWFGGTGDPLETHAVNSDPQFVNASTGDFTLQSSSPAIDRGGSLTTSTNSGANAAELQVVNAAFFQDGWATGVTPDWIAVGTATNAAPIASIDYTTNTITLAAPLTWSSNASVWLYKDSSGRQVLYGTAPDIGAYEYSSGTPTPPPPPPSPEPVPDTTPPIVSITSPLNGGTIPAKSSLTIQASASDNIGVSKVDFFINGTLKCSDTTSPYTCSWNVPGKVGRTYRLQGQATDTSGNLGTSSIITVTAK